LKATKGAVVPVKRTRLVARRKVVGFSQEMLAERLQVDRSTVVRWERGECDPQPWKRAELAQALRVSVEQLDELLTWEGTATASPDEEYAGVTGRAGESGGKRLCGGCGLPLSRYNPGELCQSCISHSEKDGPLLRGGGPGGGSTPGLTGGGAVAEVHVGDRLAALRGEAGLTQEALAERSGFSVDVIRKLEQHRKSEARLSTLRALAGALGVDVAALVGPAERGDVAGVVRGPGPGGAGVSSVEVPQDGDDVARALRVVLAAGWARDGMADVDDVERREFLRLAGAVSAAVPLAGADRVRRSVDGALDAPTTAADVAEWERVAARYAAGLGSTPPAAVLRELLTDLDEAHARLRGAPGAFRAPMARVCGYLSALAAIKFMGSGNEGEARRYWRTALRTIDHADDRTARASLYGYRAVFALDDGSPPETALLFANDAIGIAGGIPSAGAARGYVARATALALLGGHQESTRTLGDLADTFAGMSGTTASSRGTWGYSEQELNFTHSRVYSYAGRSADATRSWEAGRALVPPDTPLAVATFELGRATSLILDADPSEGARHVVRTVSKLPPGYRQAVIVRWKAVRALNAVPDTAANVPAVVEARELLALPPGAGA
jgi:transcriptional regulator with XRE-family HTH domain